MKQYQYYFADGSSEFASTAIEAFIKYNSKRISRGYGIVTSLRDEKGIQHNIQVIDHH